MIAVDTNILVRYAVKDDRHQTALATGFLAANQCYVLKTVLTARFWSDDSLFYINYLVWMALANDENQLFST